jgi:hypothetical protein
MSGQQSQALSTHLPLSRQAQRKRSGLIVTIQKEGLSSPGSEEPIQPIPTLHEKVHQLQGQLTLLVVAGWVVLMQV